MKLKMALVARGAYNLLFAIYLCAAPLASAHQALHATGWFVAVDGLLALAVAAAAQGNARTRWLVVPAIVDALARLGVGVLVLAYPDIEERILSAMFFFSATIVLCIALALFGLLYALAARRAGRGYSPGTAWPLVVISVCTLAFGIGLAFGLSSDEGRRALVASHALVVGLTLLACGVGLSPRTRS
jgi:uncharacterized membrane protein HdeD (DUF308 family)